MSIFRPPYEENKKAAAQAGAQIYTERLIAKHNKAAKKKAASFSEEKSEPKCPFWVIIIYRTVLFILWFFLWGALRTFFTDEEMFFTGEEIFSGVIVSIVLSVPFICLAWNTGKGNLDFQCMKQPEEPVSAVPDSPEPSAEESPEGATVHTVRPTKLQSPAPDLEQAPVITKSCRPNTVTLVISIVIGLILLLVVFFIIRQAVTGSDTTKLQNQANEIAEIARKMGLPEDHPIIIEAQHIYETEDLTAVTPSERELAAAIATKINLEGEISSLKNRISSLESQVDAWREELSFYRYNAVIVPINESQYHQYGCLSISGKSYYIYNVEQAEAYGYTACDSCHNSSAFDRLREKYLFN